MHAPFEKILSKRVVKWENKPIPRLQFRAAHSFGFMSSRLHVFCDVRHSKSPLQMRSSFRETSFVGMSVGRFSRGSVDVFTGLRIRSCKTSDPRKPRLDSEHLVQTAVQPRFSRKIIKFEGSTSEVWWRSEIENRTVSNKGWTCVRLLVQLEFTRGSTAVRPIFSKVEQISTGSTSSSTEGFHFLLVNHTTVSN
jgi:hypothetical protein